MKLPRWIFVLTAAFFASAFWSLAQTPDIAPSAIPTFAGTDHDAWPITGDGLVPTPRASWGRLPNGLRYVIVPNSLPAGGTSLRLHVAVGSLHENDDQRGYAHFVEHMAFNGTTHFAAGEFPKLLQRQGSAFGAHINATTSFDQTIYKFDLADRATGLETGLRILRDIADGILFEHAEIDRERGVIRSEDLARQNPDRLRHEARLNFLFAGTSLPSRFPIGTPAAITDASPESLRAFYHAWYRPDRMTLVIVGDLDGAKAEAAIHEHFASLLPTGPAPTTPSSGQLAPQSESEPVISIFKSPHSGVSFEFISTRTEPLPPDSETQRLHQLRVNAAHMMMRNRFARLRDRPKALITAFAIDDEYVTPSLRYNDVAAGGMPKQWPVVMAIAEQELRRVIDGGFQPEELEPVKESLRAGIRTNASSAPTLSSTALANTLVYGASANRVAILGDERVDARLAAIDALTVDQCHDAFRQTWGTAAPKIFVTHHQSWSVKEADVRKTYAASRATPLKGVKAAKPVSFAYTHFGAPGKVVRREHVADLDVWLVEFANGVRLNLKKTDFDNKQVRFSVRLGTGLLEEPKNRPGLNHWIDTLFYGGLGKHTADELRRALNGHVVSLSVQTGNDAFIFNGRAASDELPLGLNLLAADITDPAFRPEAIAKINSYFSDLYDPLTESPAQAMTQKIRPFLAGGDPRFTLPGRRQLSSYTLKNFKEWITPTLKTGAIECAIVGDIDIDDAINQTARTLGALPRREPRSALTAERRLTFPTPPASKTFTFVSKTRPATLDLYWPVRTTPGVVETWRLQLLAQILKQRLDDIIREEMGETYSSNAFFSWDVGIPGFAHLRCTLQIKRDKTAEIIPIVRQIVDKLARDGVTEDELTRSKAPSLTWLKRAERQNDYWLFTVLADAQERPSRLEDARIAQTVLETTTQAHLNELAARTLAADNLFEFTIKPTDPVPKK